MLLVLKKIFNAPDFFKNIGSFHNKQAKLKSMIWWAMKHSFFPPIISSMMKAVPRHHIRPSVQHTSFILKILIG